MSIVYINGDGFSVILVESVTSGVVDKYEMRLLFEMIDNRQKHGVKLTTGSNRIKNQYWTKRRDD
jgi:hypothetical protein